MRRIRTILVAATVSFIAIAPVSTARAANVDWEFRLAPYLWFAGIKGTAGFGAASADIDDSFSDLAEVTQFAGSLHFEAHRGPWGVLGEVFYVKLEEDVTGPLGGTINVQTKQSIIEAAATYEFVPKLEGILGLRYQDVDEDFTFAGPPGSASGGASWTDGFVGARWTPVLTDHWLLWVRADIGSGQSEFVWLAGIGGGYRFNETIAVVGGYKYLDTNFEEEDGSFRWDMAMKGVALGMNFTW